MGLFKKKTVLIWIAVNKNGKLTMHATEPSRDEDLGIWISDMPFVNSVLYDNLSKMISKTPMNWESDPQPFQFNV